MNHALPCGGGAVLQGKVAVDRCSHCNENPLSLRDVSPAVSLGCKFNHCPAGCPLESFCSGQEAMDSYREEWGENDTISFARFLVQGSLGYYNVTGKVAGKSPWSRSGWEISSSSSISQFIPNHSRSKTGTRATEEASSYTTRSSMVERVDGVVKVPYAVWSASNEQLWSTSVHVLGRFSSRESRFVRNFDRIIPGYSGEQGYPAKFPVPPIFEFWPSQAIEWGGCGCVESCTPLN